MNTHPTITPPSQSCLRISARQFELGMWAILLLFCNFSLLRGYASEHYIFLPEAIVRGEWFRIILSPFTHVSGYHFSLDATAFLLLWNGLQENSPWGRFAYFIGCWTGSLAVPLFASSQIYSIGLCGLSGIAHGLFIVTALEMVCSNKDKSSRYLGTLLMIGLFVKTGWEQFSGGQAMSALHLGDVGFPIVSSHLGGIIGGTIAFILLRKLMHKQIS